MTDSCIRGKFNFVAKLCHFSITSTSRIPCDIISGTISEGIPVEDTVALGCPAVICHTTNMIREVCSEEDEYEVDWTATSTRGPYMHAGVMC